MSGPTEHGERIVRVEIDGEWQVVHGVEQAEVVYAVADQDSGTIQATAERWAEQAQMIAAVYAEAGRRAIAAALPYLKEIAPRAQVVGAALRQAGLVDDEGKLARRPDRPAWQSPYGPPASKGGRRS